MRNRGAAPMTGGAKPPTRAVPPTILNGFHETWPIVYPEDAFGMARCGGVADLVVPTLGAIGVNRVAAGGAQLAQTSTRPCSSA